MSRSINPLHTAAQHLKPIAVTVAASHTSGRPTAYLINNVCRAFDGSQSISHAVPKGVNDAPVWSMVAKPFIQSSAC